MKLRILIADDHEVVRRGLCTLLQTHEGWEVCGEAEDGRVAIEKVRQFHPDVVVLDWQMPVMDGLEAAKEIRRLAPSTILLMITLHDSVQLAETAHAAGINQVLSKSDDIAEHLIASLKDVTTATTIASAEHSS